MIPFFSAINLSSKDVVGCLPWDFCPSDPDLEVVRKKPKEVRRKWTLSPDTKWQCYSAYRGLNPGVRINGSDNQARAMRGLAIDFDATLSAEQVVETINSQTRPQSIEPQWLETSIGKKNRLVWVFERELLVMDNEHAAHVFRTFCDKLNVEHLLPGFDPASYRPTELWTNGGRWTNLNPDPVAWSTIQGVAALAAKKASLFGRQDIPLEVLGAEAEKRFPGRWQGDFKIDCLGVRFWDNDADCETGAQIKPDGMLCFTGKQAFTSWEEIFGKAWCDEQRVVFLGNAAAGFYFDGRQYWREIDGLWKAGARGDVVLKLGHRGLSDKIPKGESISDAGRILITIQEQNRVEAAAPLVNFARGLVVYEKRKFLNIHTLHFMDPAPAEKITGDPEKDYPFINKLLTGIFARPQEHPYAHFMAWMQRAVIGMRNHERSMGQAVFWAGPKHNGKTLVIMKIFAPLMGYRVANPYNWLVGDTQFTSELFECSTLAINDEEAPRSYAHRQTMLARLKSLVVNPQHTYEPKFCARVNIPWNGRVFISCNDDQASIGLLPEVNPNTQDKLMFFMTQPFKGQWPTVQVIEDTIDRELPYLLFHLLNIWKAPDFVLESSRMGVKSFFDSVTLSIARTQSYEFDFRELVREWGQQHATWKDPSNESRQSWIGNPTQLRAQLEEVPSIKSALHEFPIKRIASSLSGLSRIKDSGFKFIGVDSRDFQIERWAAEQEQA